MEDSFDQKKEAQELPKPCLPEFPNEFSDCLPEGLTPSNIHEHCTCWNCIPKLWEPLSEHVKHMDPLIEDEQGYTWAYEALRKSCDIRTVTKFMVKQLNDMRMSKMPLAQHGAFLTIKQAQNQMKEFIDKKTEWNGMPSLITLGNALDTLFFRGCIQKTCTYEWVTHNRQQEVETQMYGFCAHYEEEKCLSRISITALGHPAHSGVVPYIVPQRRADYLGESILSTILHEQLHQLLHHYVCNGNCKNATESQKKLCAYLYARTIGLFWQVDYQGKRHEFHDFAGHGPVFQLLGRQIGNAACQLLSFKEIQTIGSISTCYCEKGKESRCLSHCCEYYQYANMQQECLLGLEDGHVCSACRPIPTTR